MHQPIEQQQTAKSGFVSSWIKNSEKVWQLYGVATRQWGRGFRIPDS
jgi:hypothetical protein